MQGRSVIKQGFRGNTKCFFFPAFDITAIRNPHFPFHSGQTVQWLLIWNTRETAVLYIDSLCHQIVWGEVSKEERKKSRLYWTSPGFFFGAKYRTYSPCCCGSRNWMLACTPKVTHSIPSQGTWLGCRPGPQLKSFCMARENISKMKGNQPYGKIYLPMMPWKKVWYTKYIKNSHVSTPGRWIIQLKNGQRTWTDTSPRRTYREPRDTWKNAQHHWPSERCKLRPQCNTTSPWSEWPSLTNQ